MSHVDDTHLMTFKNETKRQKIIETLHVIWLAQALDWNLKQGLFSVRQDSERGESGSGPSHATKREGEREREKSDQSGINLTKISSTRVEMLVFQRDLWSTNTCVSIGPTQSSLYVLPFWLVHLCQWRATDHRWERERKSEGEGGKETRGWWYKTLHPLLMR